VDNMVTLCYFTRECYNLKVTLSEKWVKAPLSDFELKIEGHISEGAKNRSNSEFGFWKST
jgi:hypothetical protein